MLYTFSLKMSQERRKKKTKKVYPTSEDEGLVNDGYEMDDIENNKMNNR